MIDHDYIHAKLGISIPDTKYYCKKHLIELIVLNNGSNLIINQNITRDGKQDCKLTKDKKFDAGIDGDCIIEKELL
jgi:hypothetical protein